MPQDRVAELALKRFQEGIGGDAAAFLMNASASLLGLELGEEPDEFSLEELSIISDMLVSGNEDLFEVHWGVGESHALDVLLDLRKIWVVFMPDALSYLFQRDFNSLAVRQVESGVAEMTAQVLEGRPLTDVLIDRYRDVYIEKAKLVAGLCDVVEEDAVDPS